MIIYLALYIFRKFMFCWFTDSYEPLVSIETMTKTEKRMELSYLLLLGNCYKMYTEYLD